MTDDMYRLSSDPGYKSNYHHLSYCCKSAIQNLDEIKSNGPQATNQLNKAIMWLGFVQGALWAYGVKHSVFTQINGADYYPT